MSRASELQACAHAIYNNYLSEIQMVVGHTGVTSEDTLTATARGIFGLWFDGTVAMDEYQQQARPGWRGIVNLDDRDQPGSHWVAVADGMVYDSFGRELSGFASLIQTDPDAEQRQRETNCGQRSLAWLCVAFAHGSLMASLI